MIVKCPTCCREYNVDSGKYVSEYTFRCPNCKSEILIRNSDGIIKERGMSEPQQIIVYRDNKSKKGCGCSGCFAKFAILATVLVFLLALTCPDKNDHREAIQYVVTNAVDDLLREQMPGNELAVANVSSLTSQIVDEAINSVRVEKYFIVSIGEVYDKGDHIVISVGILNHVFTADEKEVKNNIKKYLKDNQLIK